MIELLRILIKNNARRSDLQVAFIFLVYRHYVLNPGVYTPLQVMMVFRYALCHAADGASFAFTSSAYYREGFEPTSLHRLVEKPKLSQTGALYKRLVLTSGCDYKTIMPVGSAAGLDEQLVACLPNTALLADSLASMASSVPEHLELPPCTDISQLMQYLRNIRKTHVKLEDGYAFYANLFERLIFSFSDYVGSMGEFSKNCLSRCALLFEKASQAPSYYIFRCFMDLAFHELLSVYTDLNNDAVSIESVKATVSTFLKVDLSLPEPDKIVFLTSGMAASTRAIMATFTAACENARSKGLLSVSVLVSPHLYYEHSIIFSDFFHFESPELTNREKYTLFTVNIETRVIESVVYFEKDKIEEELTDTQALSIDVFWTQSHSSLMLERSNFQCLDFRPVFRRLLKDRSHINPCFCYADCSATGKIELQLTKLFEEFYPCCQSGRLVLLSGVSHNKYLLGFDALSSARLSIWGDLKLASADLLVDDLELSNSMVLLCGLSMVFSTVSRSLPVYWQNISSKVLYLYSFLRSLPGVEFVFYR